MQKNKNRKLAMGFLDTINPKDIIYAEYASPGAMGCSGSVMMYLLEGLDLICFKASVYNNQEVYSKAVDLLMAHQNKVVTPKTRLKEVVFNLYNGGFGNRVFVNKAVVLKIKKDCFIYEKGNIEYEIIASVRGVFERVIYAMQNPEETENKLFELFI